VLRHHSNRYLSLRVQLVQTHLRLTTTPNVENRKFKIITNRLDILERENLLHNRILNALESKKKPYTAVLFFFNSQRSRQTFKIDCLIVMQMNENY